MKVLDIWKKIIKNYEVPSIVKGELLLPYFSKLKLKGPVLDVGSGTGYFSELLAGRGFNVTGIDQNKIYLRSKVKYLVGDARALSFKERLFGSVLLINVLSCVDKEVDRIKILCEAKRVKLNKGRIYVVNTSENLFRRNLYSDVLSFKKLGSKKVFLSVRKLDGSVIQFEDYIITKKDMGEYCHSSGLKIVKFKEFISSKVGCPVYSLYVLE